MKSKRNRSWFALSVAFLVFALSITDQVNAKKENGGVRTAPAPAPQVSTDPSVSGQWVVQSDGTTVDKSWPVTPVHINLLPNGKFLFWGRDKAPDGSGFDIEGFTTVRLWDPFYRDFLEVNNTRTNLFCSGHSFLPDGRLLVAGGHEVLESRPLNEGLGSKHTNIFDFRNSTWTAGPDMNNGRWYPFNVTLATGETMILSGSFLNNPDTGSAQLNRVPQVFTPQGSLRALVQNLFSVGTLPHLHLMPSTNVFIAAHGFNTASHFVNGTPPGTWQQGPFLHIFHDTGTSVSYADGKVLIAGGRSGNVPHKQVELYDDAAFQLGWQTATSMKYERMYVTSTLLPDGKVLVSGGTTCTGTNNVDCPTGAVKNPELWNPANGTWTEMKPHQEVRVYHSTAILMPDGRVLVGGGGLPGAVGEPFVGDAAQRKFEHRNVEIFEPPYLFKAGGQPATRPAIASAPKEVTYGQNFTVGVGNVSAQEVEAAVLIRLGAVTHGFNQDQRRVPLAITPSADGLSLNVAAPVNPSLCPPGHYMLFLLKRNEANLTPSIARIIRVNKISPSSNLQVFSSTSESRNLAITATPGTAWLPAVAAGSEFITISTGQTVGSGTLNFAVAQNLTGFARSGKIVINVPNEGVFNQEIFVYQGKRFTDVPEIGTLEPASKVNAMGISAGCGGTNFCATRLVSRGEIAVFFVAAALGPGVSVRQATTRTFLDVDPTNPFFNFIEDFAKRGFSAGCGGGNFCPTRTVTRGELAAFLVRAQGLTARSTNTQTFTDVPVGHLFHKVVQEVVARGLMTGCGGQQFCPNQEVSRLEVAQALVKAYGF